MYFERKERVVWDNKFKTGYKAVQEGKVLYLKPVRKGPPQQMQLQTYERLIKSKELEILTPFQYFARVDGAQPN